MSGIKPFNRELTKTILNKIEKEFPKFNKNFVEGGSPPTVYLTKDQGLSMSSNEMFAFYLEYKERLDDYTRRTYPNGFDEEENCGIVSAVGFVLRIVFVDKELIKINGIESKSVNNKKEDIVEKIEEKKYRYYSKGEFKTTTKLAPIIKNVNKIQLPFVFITLIQVEKMDDAGIFKNGVRAYYEENKVKMDAYSKKIYKNLFVKDGFREYVDKNLLKEPFQMVSDSVLVGYVYKEII